MTAALRVVEIAHGVGGAVCGRLFAGLGHDVVKCEPPGGDPLRRQPPLNSEGTGLDFVALNADKRSVVRPTGLADGLSALFDTADVLILDLTRDEAAALGITPERLRSSWPRLVAVWITGFGLDGELSGLPSDSLLAEAYGGLATMIGEAGRRPLGLGGEQTAYCAGMTGLLGAMLALIRRDGGQGGDVVHVALCDVAAYMDWKSDVVYHMTGAAPARLSADSGEWRLIRVADGWVGFIFQQRHWGAFVELVGAPELRDPELADETIRIKAGSRWWPIVERWAAGLHAEDIYDRAQRLGLPFGWVVTAAGLLRSRQLRGRGFVPVAEGDRDGLTPALGTPVHSSALSWRSGRAPGIPAFRIDRGAKPAAGSESAVRPPEPAGTSLPLRGVVVLDFGTITAGAAVTRLFADHGATVVKIEWPDHPDTFRGWKIPAGATQDSPYFPSNNAGKLGAAINLKTAEGQRLVRQLATRAHVFVENYRAGVTRRLGIDDATLRAANPDLIYLSLSSQGQDGPESRNISFGSTLDLLSGLASLTGYEDGRPIWSSSEVNYPDQLVSLVGAGFIAYCLRMKLAGVHLDISQREVVSWTLAAQVAGYLATGRDPVPDGNRRAGRTPHDTFCTAGQDSWIAVSCRTNAERAALARHIGAAELAGHDERWWDEHRGHVAGLVTAWTSRRSRDECAAELRAAGVAAVPVLTAADRAATPRFAERKVTFPTDTGPVKGFPMLFREYQPPASLSAPLIGEHTREVLTKLGGVSPQELSRLEQQGVIRCAPPRRSDS